MADSDRRDSKIVRTRQIWRAGHKYRSDLSLVLLKEKMTKITQITWEIRSYPKALKMSFISGIHYASLCNAGRTQEFPELYGQISGYAPILQGADALQWVRQPWLQDTQLMASQKQNWMPWSCPLHAPGFWLEYHSTGLFSSYSFERKSEWTTVQGTAWLHPVQKQAAAKLARRAVWGCLKSCSEAETQPMLPTCIIAPPQQQMKQILYTALFINK